jgi:uncharacterized protein YciI
MHNKEKMYFAAIMPSPRPSFPADMSDEERRIMKDHSEFWKALMEDGQGIIAGPVLDPKGAYGYGVVVAGSADEVRTLLENDPAQKINKIEIYQMLAMVPDGMK